MLTSALFIARPHYFTWTSPWLSALWGRRGELLAYFYRWEKGRLKKLFSHSRPHRQWVFPSSSPFFAFQLGNPEVRWYNQGSSDGPHGPDTLTSCLIDLGFWSLLLLFWLSPWTSYSESLSLVKISVKWGHTIYLLCKYLAHRRYWTFPSIPFISSKYLTASNKCVHIRFSLLTTYRSLQVKWTEYPNIQWIYIKVLTYTKFRYK